MTVASEESRSGPYIGNGATKVFPYGFRILTAAHLRVVRTETNADTVLTLGADYTVSGVGNVGGGSITMIAAPTASQTITLLRNVPFTQETDLENQGAYFAETVEASFDLSVMRDQQLSERLSRAVVMPASTDPGDISEFVTAIDNAAANAQIAIDARDAANAAASALGNQVHQYDTRALAIAAAIPSDVSMVHLFGRSTIGDGGKGDYIRLGSAPIPARSWHFQNSVDSSWWQLVGSPEHQFEQFGSTGSAIQDAIDFVAGNGGGTVHGRPSHQYRVTAIPTIDPSVTLDLHGGSIVLDALTLTTLGDSITAGSGASDFNGTISPAKGYAPLLAAHYGWALNNTGRSGEAVSDQGNESFAQTPARGSVYTLFLGTNDKILNAADNLNREINTASGHLAELLQLAIRQDANKVRGQSMTVLAGSWSNLTSGTDAHGVASSTNGSALEAVVEGRHVVLVGWWNALQTGQFAVSIDLKSVGTFNATPFGSQTLGNGGVEYGPFALVFSDLPKGKHKVRIAVTSATDAAKVVRVSFVAGLDGVVDHTNPLVAVGNLHEFTDAGNTAQGVTYGRNERLNNIIAGNIAICQKLGLNVVPVEVYDTLDPATDCPTDGIHPNDAGHVKLKNAFVAAIDGSWSSYKDRNPSEFAKAAFVTFRGHPYGNGQSLTMQDWRYRPA